MAAPPIHPVRLEGRLDPGLSRWLWLVKWLLAIPHFIVLAFLWIAFFVLSVVAFFAILFTARYPRGIFEFNLGVLRWTWRVAFYSYGALGTDRYPPFTLGAVPDYPATLEVTYPGELSRGLVLVKWWLLAIPHYLILGLLLGGGWFAWGGDWDRGGDGDWGGGPGLIGLLVLFAGVALLFTTRYPRAIFDFVLGLDRWVARVVAYAGLMTDAYPPFRLEQGGEERAPVAGAGEPTAPAPTSESVERAPRAGKRGGGVVLLVLGSIAALLAFALLAGGCAAVVLDRTQRDDDGFLMTPTEDFSTATYAIVSQNADLDLDGPDWATTDFFGTARIRSESERPVFVGIAREADVAGYLGGVERAVVTEVDEAEYSERRGGAPEGRPADQTFWAASATGAGEQTLEWEPEDGSWNVVLMNADGSRGVAAELSIGGELDPLIWIGVGLLVGGALLAAAAALAITAGIRRRR
jgi:Domain of unknown function (DUF4389)